MAQLEKRLQKLTPEKRQLLELLRQSPTRLGGLERVSRKGGVLMSYAQQRVWFMEQMEGGKGIYNLRAGVRMKGELKVEVMRRVVREVVRRHEVLRTRFGVEGGKGVQIIEGEGKVELEVGEVSGGSKEEREEELRREMKEEGERGFDVEEGPLLRVKVWKVGEGEHVLLLTMHHMVSDGWSMGVLLREVSSLYEDYEQGRESRLGELRIQYADYAGWQREWLQGERLEEQVSYWRKQLEGVGVLEMGTDHVRPGVPSYRGGKVKIEVGKELVGRVKELSKREGVTVYMVVVAAVQMLLWRYSGQEDVAVGTVIANRRRGELEGLIGFFANTLVLRTRVGGEERVKEVLRRVREVCLGAYGHQDLPFEKLVEEMNPGRDLSRNPLFQVMVTLQNVPGGEMKLGGVELERMEGEEVAARFDLDWTLEENEGGGLSGELVYARDLWEEETAERMVRHWVRGLEEMVRDEEQRVWEVEWMKEGERVRVLEEWNGTERGRGERERSVQERIEEQVRKRGGETAVECGGEEVSYEELNGRANQLANYLRGEGVGAETRVGLCMERGVEMLVGMLGIVKAGGAYVPLDPEYPEERLRYMVRDAEMGMVVSEEKLRGRWEEGGVRIVSVDGEQKERIGERGRENPEEVTSGENAAYVIYTSGSSGEPKGVVVSHGNVSNFLAAMDEVIGGSAPGAWLAVTSMCFDISVLELLWTLTHGDRIVLHHGLAAGKAGEVDWKGKDVQCTPTYAEGMVEEWREGGGEGEKKWKMRKMLVGGEAMGEELARELEERVEEGLYNMYGPTETTVWSCVEKVEKGKVGKVGIGKPIRNTRVYVLDERMKAAPVGVVGELYIGGAGVARGYWKRAEQTAERFVPDPYGRGRGGEGGGGGGEGGGGRLYRTGDAVRWREDGVLEYVGRMDEQVKIRGYRIEPGEIEAALRGMEEIREAVVVAREDVGVGGGKRLVGYVVGEKGKEVPGTRELRRRLQGKLPEYMIPAVVVELEELPQTPNGKLDRRGLPLPERGREEEEGGYEEPASELEEILCGIWEELLGVERVGRRDNFFELGGHSLLATQLMAKLRGAFGVDPGLRALFENPSVAYLASVLNRVKNPTPLHAEGLRASDRTRPLPLSFAQQRLWFADQFEPNSAIYNLPVAVRLSGVLDLEALHKSLDESVRRHEILRTRFGVVDHVPVQIVTEYDPSALRRSWKHVDLRHLAGQPRESELQRQIEEESMRPFDLEQGPLIRASVFLLAEDEHILLITMHHIITDAWSMDILVREVSVLYDAFTSRRGVSLPELPIQYGDYAVWQRERLEPGALDQQSDYWKKHLAELTTVNLPSDRPRPAGPSYSAADVPIAFPPTLLMSLRTMQRQESLSLFMLLLASFQLFLARYSNQEDVSTGTDVANRGQSEVEPLVGFFVNQIVLRTHVPSRLTVRELLQQVRERCLEAYANHDVPFERLVEELNPDRTSSGQPLFNTKFLLQHVPRNEAQVSTNTLHIAPYRIARTKIDVDLLITLVESPDGITGTCAYSADMFDATTVESMLSNWQTLVEQMTLNPDKTVFELSMLSDAEMRELLAHSTPSQGGIGTDQLLPALFEEQAGKKPDNTAIEAGREQVTYKQLNARSSRLARYLVACGVMPEVRVGIYISPGVDMMVALLGTLKAGAAYVPIDTAYPLDRSALMLEDAQVAIILTERRLADHLPAGLAQIVCLDDSQSMKTSPGDNMPVHIDVQNAAYVMYTSGSTGKPNGVVVTHSGLANYLLWSSEAYGTNETSTSLVHSSVSFDLTVTSMFLPLIRGGKIIFPDEEEQKMQRRPDRRWSDVSLLKMTPSHLTWFSPELRNGRSWSASETVVIGGEALSYEQLQAWREGDAKVRLFNEYGPTEAVVGCCVYEVKTNDPIRGPVPIGTPIANTNLYVTDLAGNLAPKGVVGELCLGGLGLARGYLNRADITAEKFIPNPFSHLGGERLYRTGDLARWRVDGELEYVGRIDDQIKVRGYRIEVGEVESRLRSQAGVQDAAVIARPDQFNQMRLIAYLVYGKEARPLDHNDVKGELRKMLPEYMLPSEYVELECLPLTVNGKVDRQRLPKPDGTREKSPAFVGPTTPVEELVCSVWSRALSVERVGLDDDFFEIGGHSLLATQIVLDLQKALHIDLSLRDLFESRTPRRLAGVSGEMLLKEVEGLSEEEAVQFVAQRRTDR